MALGAGLGALFAAALVFQAAGLAQTWGGASWPFDFAAGAVVCALALARRRDRVRTAAAGLAVAAAAIVVARLAGLPSEPSPAMAMGLAVLVGSAVRVLPVRQAVAVAVGGLVVALGGLLGAALAAANSAVAVLNGVAWAAAVAFGLALRLLAARRRAAAERVRREERLELARELHDVVAHHIASIVLMAQAAPITARKGADSAAASFAGIEAAGAEALAATRRVVGLLRDSDDAAPVRPGPEGLGELVGRFGGRGPAVDLRLPEGEPQWPPEVTSTVYRVVQEALTNVVRHARRASAVTVTVGQDDGAVTVEVVDDAQPVRRGPAPDGGGFGLLGMRERVEALGGTLRAGPGAEGGWSVRAVLPLPYPRRRAGAAASGTSR
ncbi:signal transduction histidine kinase [Allonocardiopsis opalescens]|uniref:histidine kinase n=1 Tax=Allonocardiopsis opalescens TaxID=1144618 RepID=A0A2T0PMJ9_9ACTN|nr:signal transduction histidine kinase [Allonocardiopsis opalescens]